MGYTPRGYSTTGGSDTFHFPDGNASIARLLVRDLIPDAMPGHDAKDIVSARCDYAKLDRMGNAVRIRLNSLVVRARNAKDGVEIAYTRSSGGGEVMRVRAKHAVLANWNMIIPYLVPELPAAQKAALHALVKTPLVYTNVALKNWTAFEKLKISSVFAPGSYFSSIQLNPHGEHRRVQECALAEGADPDSHDAHTGGSRSARARTAQNRAHGTAGHIL